MNIKYTLGVSDNYCCLARLDRNGDFTVVEAAAKLDDEVIVVPEGTHVQCEGVQNPNIVFVPEAVFDASVPAEIPTENTVVTTPNRVLGFDPDIVIFDEVEK